MIISNDMDAAACSIIVFMPASPFSRHQIQTMTRRIFTCLAAILVAGGCTNPRVQANIAQALNDVGSELTAQRQDMAILQEQVDSLKRALAHQDTTIKRLANITGIPPSP